MNQCRRLAARKTARVWFPARATEPSWSVDTDDTEDTEVRKRQVFMSIFVSVLAGSER